MRTLFKVLVPTLLAAAWVQFATAQTPQSPLFPVLRSPRPSQGQRITQVVGLSEATIYYHRPGVKGRTIWGPKGSGALLPYGEVWRAGANEPTLFTFSDNVTIAGKKLSAGTYRFVVIPGEKEWTLVFNAETKNWGTIYDAAYDTLRFTVTPQQGSHEEWMTFSFNDPAPNSTMVMLSWETKRVSFKIEFDLLSKLQVSVGGWSVPSNAARYAVDNKIYLNEAMTWIERSLALDKNFFNLRTKAELLALNGKTAEAIAAAEEGLKIIKAGDVSKLSTTQQGQVRDTENLLAQWKMKK